MLTVQDQIRELCSELAGCALTRCERTQAQAEVAMLISRQEEMDRADAALFADDAAPD